MKSIPSQCLRCSNFNKDESLCSIHEQLPGEFGRENIEDCPSFLEDTPKNREDLRLLIEYMDEDPDSKVEQSITAAVDRILNNYESKYKVLIIGIARRKIKSIVKMVDIIDGVLDKLGSSEILNDMGPSQAIRLLSELNHSINNDLTFIMKLVNPDTKLQDLQAWIDARTTVVNVSGASKETDMKAEEIMKLSSVSRDKIRDAFDVLLRQLEDPSEVIDVIEEEDDEN